MYMHTRTHACTPIYRLLTICSVSDCVRSLTVWPPVVASLSKVEEGDSVFVVTVDVTVDVLNNTQQ